MTVKCCRDCMHLGKQNIPKTGWLCANPIIQIVPNGQIDTFYCSAFTRRNSANKNSQSTQLEEEQQLPPIQRRFV